MALTIAARHNGVVGNLRLIIADITFDNSYPTGGEAILPKDLGLNSVIAILPASGAAEEVVWDRANGKLKILTADATEATNASDQSAVVAQVIVFGN